MIRFILLVLFFWALFTYPLYTFEGIATILFIVVVMIRLSVRKIMKINPEDINLFVNDKITMDDLSNKYCKYCIYKFFFKIGLRQVKNNINTKKTNIKNNIPEALEFFKFNNIQFEQMTLNELKTVHRNLAKIYHPDSGIEKDSFKFQELQKHYEVLYNLKKVQMEKE